MNINEKGFSTIEFLIGAVFITFVIFFPIVIQMEMHTIHIMEQELDRTLQMVSVEGYVSDEIYRTVQENLSKKGIDEVDVISSPLNYPQEKGGEIDVVILAERPNKSMFSGVMNLIGGDDIEQDLLKVEGTIMSEYIP